MTPIRTIRLYGKLGGQYGRIHRLAVSSAAEAIRALCVLIPGFERELMTSRDRGIAYAVFLGKKNIDHNQLINPSGREEIRIAPVLQGAKSAGLFQIILGAALIAIAYAMTPAGTTFSLSKMLATKGMIGIFSQMGLSMMLGGVMQLLSPQPKGLSVRDAPENGASYHFNGAVNTSAQGNSVPLGYGRMIVGSAVISAGVYTTDQA